MSYRGRGGNFGDRGGGRGEYGQSSRGYGGSGERGARGGFRGSGRGQGPAPLDQHIGPIKLKSNHYQLAIKQNCPTFYKHLVEIVHRDASERLRAEFRQELLEAFLREKGYDPASIAYDGDRIIVHPEPIKLGGEIKRGKATVSITITPQGSPLNLRDLEQVKGPVSAEHVQVLDVILKFCTRKVTEDGGRTRFLHQKGSALIDLAKHSGSRDAAPRCLWMGHYQAFHVTNANPFSATGMRRELTVCVNAAASLAYEEQDLLEFLRFRTGVDFTTLRPPLQRTVRRQFEAETRGLKFDLIHLNRMKKLATITDSTARDFKFDRDGNTTSVEDYFEDVYNLKLKYPNAPLVQVMPKNREIFIPIELLRLKRQRIAQATSDFLKSIVGDIMTMEPGKRYNYIEQATKETFGRNMDLDKFMSISGSLTVEGTVLEPPTLLYHGSGNDRSMAMPVEAGRWTLRGCAFTSGQTVGNWALYNCTRTSMDAIKQLFAQIQAMANSKLNMRFNPSPKIAKTCGSPNDLDNEVRSLRDLKAEGKVIDMAFIIIQDRATDWYRRIKEAFDPICPSQVLCARRTPILNGKDRGVDGHLANILSKINMKLGGANQRLFHERCKVPALRQFIGNGVDTVVFGGDISHPSAASCPNVQRRNELPSLAALVASMDRECTKYAHAMRAQSGPQDVIQHLDSMFELLLSKRRVATGASQWPNRVIYLRDGIADNALGTLADEIDTLKGCYTRNRQPPPLILAIAVRKRHQTRFFPTGAGDSRTNAHPGTMVFDNLSMPLLFDNFYLIPHAGIKGTSHPVRCVVLQDDFRIHDTELKSLPRPQQLERYGHMIYQLCNLYGRCQRTVSTPAPIYYAHLLADRARIHVNALTKSTLGIGTMSEDASVVSGEMAHKTLDANTMTAFIDELNKKLKEIESGAQSHFYC